MSHHNPFTQITREKNRRDAAARLAGLVAVTALLLAVLTACASPSQRPISTAAPSSGKETPLPIEGEEQVIQLVDRYYNCINLANPAADSDYEECWDLLSDQPGEYQSTLDQSEFIEFWKLYNVGYAIYYCPRGGEHFVNAETYLYALSDLDAKIIDPEKVIVEYTFASDGENWRITSGASLDKLRPNCGSRPRINKLTLPY